jgi:hypothetical protein
MTRIRNIRRAFLSYSRQDRDFANLLACDLRKNCFDAWVDFEGIRPGTRDWEVAVRAAIEESFVVLLIASPDSRQSSFVRSEILLADARNVPIFALLAKGKNWIDSIPMSLAHIQYQDFRGQAYSDSLVSLISHLSQFKASIPDHFLYESFYSRASLRARNPAAAVEVGSSQQGNQGYKIFSKQGFSELAEIQTEDIFHSCGTKGFSDTIFIRPDAFRSGSHLLDTLYIDYLSQRFPPFSYGYAWHLRGQWPQSNRRRVALDWRVLDQHRDASSNFAQLSEKLETYGILHGSVWSVEDGAPSYTLVLASYDKWLIDTILRQPKGTSALIL